jgi:hypothetical protein
VRIFALSLNKNIAVVETSGLKILAKVLSGKPLTPLAFKASTAYITLIASILPLEC